MVSPSTAATTTGTADNHRARPGPGHQLVHGVVVVGRVVVEQRQGLDARLLGHLDRVVDRAVTPVGLLLELVGGVLGVVDQQIGLLAQLEHRVGHGVERRGRLMVADVGHDHAAPLDAVADRRAAMGHRAHLHLGRRR